MQFEDPTEQKIGEQVNVKPIKLPQMPHGVAGALNSTPCRPDTAESRVLHFDLMDLVKAKKKFFQAIIAAIAELESAGRGGAFLRS